MTIQPATVTITRPPVWQMVREAAEELDGSMSYAQIREFIHEKYGEVNDRTITCQIIISSVNHPSRVHYPENTKPRPANSQYDFLFNTGRGQVEWYRPEDHGEWEIAPDAFGAMYVRQGGFVDDSEEPLGTTAAGDMAFPLESHLRDFIAQNLTKITPGGARLTLYQDADGRMGVEYPTGVGPVDILAVDDSGNLFVFELKLTKGPDYAVGQILTYMGWITKELASGKKVSGVIVAQQMSEKLKYAVSLVPAISLYEYQLTFDLTKAQLT